MRRLGRLPAFGLGLSALVLVIDQASKAAMLVHFAGAPRPTVRLGPFLNLVLLANRGVSFGLFNGAAGWQPAFFSLLAIVIVAILLYALNRTRSLWNAAAMGLIIGGALGNLVDRLRFGSVVDFIDFHIGRWHWFTFNLADAAICVGVGILLLDGLLLRPESPKA